MFQFYIPTPVIQMILLFLGFLIVWGDYIIIRFVDQTISGVPKEIMQYLTQVGEAWPWFTLFVLVIAFSSFVSKNYQKYYVRPAVFSIVNMLAVGIALNITKFMFGRPRPKHFLVEGTMAFDPIQLQNPFGLSFPSGHSQAIWSAAVCLSLFWPRYRGHFIVLAIIVSLTRFFLAQHYLSDVIVGALFGFTGSLLFYQKYAEHFLHGKHIIQKD